MPEKNAELMLPERKIEIAQSKNIFGRNDFERDIPKEDLSYITNKEGDKYHFMITKEEGIYYIQDDHSKNGTKLNDREIKGEGKKQLKNDDKIIPAGINNFIITFKIREASSAAWEGSKIEYKTEIIKDHTTRLVCAKLYEGGLLTASSILYKIKPKPFTGKNPEVGINIGLVAKHAENAYRYHLKFALIAAGLTLLGFIFVIINNILSGILAAATIFLIIWKWYYADKKIALENFSKISYNPNYGIGDGIQGSEVLIERESKNQNVIVFGGYLPFLGAGGRNGNWNFVIDTTKPAKSLDGKSSKPDDININELYKSVSDAIKEKNLPHISEDYILFADGKELKEGFLLPTRVGEPVDNLNPQSLFNEGHKSLYEEFRTYYRIKYYDEIRSTLFSTYLRFSKTGKEIFVESSFFVLAPIDENKYNIDKLPLYDNLLGLKVGVTAIAISILAFVTSVFNLSVIPLLILFFVTFGPLMVIFNNWLEQYKIKNFLKNKINKGEAYNYGNFQTFRESIASHYYKSYFGEKDIIMIRNIIENTTIYSIADLLDSKGIDSSFLRKDLIPFVNQGIMMYGGKLEAEQVAAGKGAIAMKPMMKGVESIKTVFGKQ